MARPTATANIDWDAVLADAARVRSLRDLAKKYRVAPSTFTSALHREGIYGQVKALVEGEDTAESTDSFDVDDDGCITGTINEGWWNPEDVIRDHGLDPDDFYIRDYRFNRWNTPDSPKGQLRFTAIPKTLVPVPPSVEDLDVPPPPAVPSDPEGGFVICSDHHAPYHDRALHANMCRYLADAKPLFGVLLGDLLDFESISRHRKTPGGPTVNDALKAAVSILRDYRQASPNTHWTFVRGNHDERVQYLILDQAPGLYGIAPGGEGEAALSLRRLLLLDELGIDYIDEEWSRAKFPATQHLTLRHGPFTGKNVLANLLGKYGGSQGQGHVHTISMLCKRGIDPDVLRVAFTTGFMGQVDEGLGYCDDPDWHQGFITGHVWSNGEFAVAPVPFVNGVSLHPDGRRYMSDPALNNGHRPSDWR